MNIQDFKFYRKNNRYYFESHELEGIVYTDGKLIGDVIIENGEETSENIRELIDLFNLNIELVLAAESI